MRRMAIVTGILLLASGVSFGSPASDVLEALEKQVRQKVPDPVASETAMPDTAGNRGEEAGQPNAPGDAGATYKFRRWAANKTANCGEFLTNRPDVLGRLSPGQLLWCDAALAGNFNGPTIGAKDNFKVVFNGVKLSKNGQAVATIDCNGDPSSYAEAIKDLKVEGGAVKIDTSVVDARTFEESMLDLGLSAHYMSYKADATLNMASKKTRHTAIAYLRQIYFTASVDVSSLPAGGPLLLRNINETTGPALRDEIKRYAGEVAYVSDINYGRVVLLALTSDTDEDTLKATAHVAAEFLSGGASVSMTDEQKSTFQSSTVRLIAMGGSTTPELKDLLKENDLDKLVGLTRGFFSSQLSLTDLQSAAPVSFSLRYARDNATMLVSDTTQYSFWKPFQKVFPGQQGVYTAKISKVGAEIVRGDGEIESGDSGAWIQPWYRVTLSPDKMNVIVEYDLQVQEKSGDLKRDSDSRFRLSGTLTPTDFRPSSPVELVTQPPHANESDRWWTEKYYSDAKMNTATGLREVRGGHQQHTAVSVPNFGWASDTTVRYDEKGRNDQNITSLTMSVNIPYRVLPRVEDVK